MNINTYNSIRKKYFKKIYDNAERIECACGCGIIIKNRDRWGRCKSFVNGHNGRKFKDPKQFKKNYYQANKQKYYKWKKNYIFKFKEELINLLGNVCKKCKIEYDGTNIVIFDFYHTGKKIYGLSQSGLNRISKHKAKKEVKKCVLLCANCHRLEHQG